ncbi:MAG: S-adenosylmethionine/tRNA-ribosyltransferase-isomerase [Verrucomicrobiales bacterium]|jgi:S-adenosylmethionine:tRNA ribosyltransferase-isomerase|nr:S-adenosylmethionine/tRNA-ribosyltransferase-isomerase [Verrucomicrobiales bacterium]
MDTERYQTCFASASGSVAAPTAGLHFTPPLIQALQKKGVSVEYVTLHVGFGTFAPVKEPEVENHHMHEERYSIPTSVAEAVQRTKSLGGKVVAVGTTSLRVLESSARANHGQVVAGDARTSIFLYPPATFAVVDSLLTNFHLPESTLLMLVAAFLQPGGTGGVEMALRAYCEAVNHKYRFFSYGDAMFIA